MRYFSKWIDVKHYTDKFAPRSIFIYFLKSRNFEARERWKERRWMALRVSSLIISDHPGWWVAEVDLLCVFPSLRCSLQNILQIVERERKSLCISSSAITRKYVVMQSVDFVLIFSLNPAGLQKRWLFHHKSTDCRHDFRPFVFLVWLSNRWFPYGNFLVEIKKRLQQAVQPNDSIPIQSFGPREVISQLLNYDSFPSSSAACEAPNCAIPQPDVTAEILFFFPLSSKQLWFI